MKRGLVTLAAVAALAGIVGLAAQSTASAQPTKKRVVDRTMVCTAGEQGGARVILLWARTAYGTGKRLESLAQAIVMTPGQPFPYKPYYEPTLAGVTAGWPPPRDITSGGLGFENKLCKATHRSIPLSPRGLIGGVASQLGDEYTCRVQRTLLVRVRAEFRRPTALKAADKRTFTAVGRMERGQIAVRTLTGKPLVYAEVSDAGKARLFTTGGCL
jgi:hypothetical protein